MFFSNCTQSVLLLPLKSLAVFSAYLTHLYENIAKHFFVSCFRQWLPKAAIKSSQTIILFSIFFYLISYCLLLFIYLVLFSVMFSVILLNYLIFALIEL